MVEYNTIIEQHEKRLDKLDVILDKVRNRLPVWATFAFAVLMGIVGWLLKTANGG